MRCEQRRDRQGSAVMMIDIGDLIFLGKELFQGCPVFIQGDIKHGNPRSLDCPDAFKKGYIPLDSGYELRMFLERLGCLLQPQLLQGAQAISITVKYIVVNGVLMRCLHGGK